MIGRRFAIITRAIAMYIIAGGIWILLFDYSIRKYITEPVYLSAVHYYEDWIFIFISAFFLSLILKRELGTREVTEQKYRNIFEHALEGIFQSTLDGHFISANPAMAVLFGYDSAQELIESVENIGAQIYVNSQLRENFIAGLLKSGVIEKFENQNYRKDGTIFWTSINARLVRDQNGTPLYIEGFITEITGSKKAKDALQASEDQYRNLVEHSPYPLAIHSRGVLVYLNQAGVRLVRANSAEELYGTPIIDFIHPDSRPIALKRLQDLNAGKEVPPLEQKFLRQDGTTIYVEAVAYPFIYQNKSAVQMVIRDLTEQKQAEQAMRASEERFSKAFHASPIPTCITTLGNGLFVDVNNAYLKLAKWRREDIIGRTAQELNIYKFDDRGKFLERLIKRQIIQGENIKFANSLGEELDVASFYELIEIGGLPCILSMFYDMTEQKRSQEAIRSNEERLRAIVDHTRNIYYSHTPDHILTYMSGQTRNILAYEPEEALINWKEFLTDHPVNQRGLMLKQQAIDTGEPQEPYVLELKAKNGRHVWVEARETPVVRDGKTVSIVGALTNITERKEAEERMERQLAELTVLHAVATAGSQSNSEDELIEKSTQIISGMLYPDNCGILLLNPEGTILKPHSAYRGASPDSLIQGFPLSMGVTGQVAASGIPIRIGDVATASAFIETTTGIHSELCVPIRVNQKIIGVLNAEGRKFNAFDGEDERLMNTVAGALGTALERIRLFKTEQKQRQNAEHIREATAALTSTLKLPDLYDTILTSLEKILPCDSASIVLEKNGEMEIVAGRGFPENSRIVGRTLPTGGRWQEIQKSQYPMILADAQADTKFQSWRETSYIHGWLGIPMIVEDVVIGFINVDSHQINKYTEEDAALGQTFANQAAMAIKNAILYKSEQRRHQETEKLRQAATAVASSLNLKEVLGLLLDALKDVVPFDSASIIMPEGENFRIVAAQGLPDQHQMLNTAYPANNQLLRHVLTSGQPLILKDAQLDDRFQKWHTSNYIHGWMAVPMIARGQTIGFITLDSFAPGAFNPGDAELAQSFAHQASIAIENTRLFENLQKTNFELSQAYDTTLEGWGKALELRDKETQGHTLRVTNLTIKLARRMGYNIEQLIQLRRGVLVHDIGKMGVPDQILHKKGPLTKKEWEEMRKHPQYAFDLLYPITYLRPALEVAYCHHEWWDGTGYPRGLRDTQIPPTARIFAVVDVWDALLYERSYRKAWSKKKVMKYIQDQAGTHFDPQVVKVFLQMVQEEQKK